MPTSPAAPQPEPGERTRRPRVRKPVEQPRPIPLRTRLLAFLVRVLVWAIGGTLRLRIENEEKVQRLLAEHGSVIFVTWHSRVFLPLKAFRGRGYWVLVSLSRDGDLVAAVYRTFGFGTIRGSTGRRGAVATREVLDTLAQGGVLAFTPDGPRGPARKVQGGVVYFAQRSGRPIIPVGNSARPRWLAPSWDRFLGPLPFARALWIYGDPIFIAPDEDPDAAALRVEESINALEAEAERRLAPRGHL